MRVSYFDRIESTGGYKCRSSGHLIGGDALTAIGAEFLEGGKFAKLTVSNKAIDFFPQPEFVIPDTTAEVLKDRLGIKFTGIGWYDCSDGRFAFCNQAADLKIIAHVWACDTGRRVAGLLGCPLRLL